jgi:hypothetical protein
MPCRQADTQWQTKNIAACNRINAIQQSWQLWWFFKSFRGIQRIWRGMDPADCSNWGKRGFKDTNENGPSLVGLLGLSSWYKRFLLCLVHKKYVLLDSFLSVYASHPQFPISICTEDCIFVYFLLHGFSLGQYILSMFCVKIQKHLKFTWTKKIRGFVMHCRQADAQ